MLFFLKKIQFYYPTLGLLGIELYNLFCFFFLWGYLGFMIRVASFDILTPIKLGYFLIFFLGGYLGVITWVTSPSTLDLFLIGLSLSHNSGRQFSKLTQLTQFF
jgi:hypothetical protein